MAIVAYKQPITRAGIEAIRGVACGEVLRSLMEHNLVKIVGRAEEIGRPMLYGTTRYFLEVFGLPNLKDLPKAESFRRAQVTRGLFGAENIRQHGSGGGGHRFQTASFDGGLPDLVEVFVVKLSPGKVAQRAIDQVEPEDRVRRGICRGVAAARSNRIPSWCRRGGRRQCASPDFQGKSAAVADGLADAQLRRRRSAKAQSGQDLYWRSSSGPGASP